MATEVTRFRIARSLQRTCFDLDKAIRLGEWKSEDVKVAMLEDATSIAELKITGASGLDLLDRWLRCKDDKPNVAELGKAIKKYLGELREDNVPPREDDRARNNIQPQDKDPPQEVDQVKPHYLNSKRAVADLLVGASESGAPGTTQRQMMRAATILGLVDLYEAGRIADPRDVYAALRQRRVLLPKSKVFRRLNESALARRPGVADLYVVRQEWKSYVAGEIAHIENVLAGESKGRVHKRIQETEETILVATDTKTSDERSTQTTNRSELREGTATDTKLTAHVEGQVDVSGPAGPMKVSTHLGGSLDYSKAESEELATEQAAELVARAVIRVEESVHEERTKRTLVKTEETNTHEMENTTNAPMVGMYRWVDKIVWLQKYMYPHRFLLEFQIPEPAAYVRWLDRQRRGQGFIYPMPAPFTANGLEEGVKNRPLLPSEITEANYEELAARYHARGINAPPAKEVTVSGWLHIASADPSQDKTSHDLWITPLSASPAPSAAGAVEGQSLSIPDGYQAKANWSGWITAWDQDDTIRPGWNTSQDDSWNWVPPGVFVTVGDSQNNPAEAGNAVNRVSDARSSLSKPIGGEISGRRVGVLPITVLSSNYGMMSVQVRVDCELTAQGKSKWQRETHATLQEAYFEMLRAHEEERAARQVRAGVEIEGQSPLENARVVRDELKRQVIEMLIGARFHGLAALELDKANTTPPRIDIAKAISTAPLLQFLEQVFEWENLTFVLYPYLWAADDRWNDLQPLTSPDPNYAMFLRAGSARVVLSVRPGFQSAVVYYIATGEPWSGGPAPFPEDDDYISVADEIEAQSNPSSKGSAVGASWSVRLPTTLITLDNNPVLPKENDAITIPAPPVGP